MNLNTQNLVICVDEISSSFIFNEISYYADKFNEVLILSKKKLGIEIFKKDNIKNIALSEIQNDKTKRFSNLRLLMSDLFSKYSSISYLKKIRYNNAYLTQAQIAAKKLVPYLNSGKPTVYFSYWFADWALVLSLLKKQGLIGHFYSRAHGRDLFEYREPTTQKLPFRLFQLQMVDGVFPVSEAGTTYLKERYTTFSAKFKTHYLGTADHGINPFNKENIFTILTCARVRDVKRIHLVPEILKQLDFEVKWIHIGDENLKDAKDKTIRVYIENKKSLEAFKNIKTEFKGLLTNDEVFEFYKNTSVNLFLNLSESEGLPVVLIEALSMGIPIMATDVGGCKEIVTKETGFLIQKNFSIEEVAKNIKEFKNADPIKLRKQVRQFWEENFIDFKNYNNLLEELNTN